MINRGVYSATCSILREDYSLNVEATIAHAASTINNGLHGVIFFGSTGQSQLISISEKKDLIAKIASHKLRKQFFLGTGCNSLNETIDLIKYGYQYRLSDALREKALKKAIKQYSALSVYRKLDAVSKLSLRTAPDASNIFKRDRNWIKENYDLTD